MIYKQNVRKCKILGNLFTKDKPTAGLRWLNDYFWKQSYVRGIILINERKYVDKEINNDQSMFVAY